MTPCKSEFRASISRVALALSVFPSLYAGSDDRGIAEVESGEEPARNLEVMLEMEVIRPYSSWVSERIECKIICTGVQS